MPKEIKIKKTDDEFEALGAFFTALIFFFRHPIHISSAVFFALTGANMIFHYFNFSADKARVGLAAPMSESRPFTIIPEAIASDVRPDTLRINGVAYGIKDPMVDAWKLKGKSVVILHDKDHDVVIEAQVDGLDHERMQQLKKGK